MLLYRVCTSAHTTRILDSNAYTQGQLASRAANKDAGGSFIPTSPGRSEKILTVDLALPLAAYLVPVPWSFLIYCAALSSPSSLCLFLLFPFLYLTSALLIQFIPFLHSTTSFLSNLRTVISCSISSLLFFHRVFERLLRSLPAAPTHLLQTANLNFTSESSSRSTRSLSRHAPFIHRSRLTPHYP